MLTTLNGMLENAFSKSGSGQTHSRESSPVSNGMLENAFFKSGSGQKQSRALESSKKHLKTFQKRLQIINNQRTSVKITSKSVESDRRPLNGMGRIRATKREVDIVVLILSKALSIKLGSDPIRGPAWVPLVRAESRTRKLANGSRSVHFRASEPLH